MPDSSRRRSSLIRCGSMLAALLWAATADAQQTPQRYLIEFREYRPGAAALVRGLGGTPVHEFPAHRTIAASLPEQAVAALVNTPGILRIERDAERYPLTQTVPYGISMVQANLVTPDARSAMVCVIDSGYSLGHPDLPGADGTETIAPTGDDDSGAGMWDIDRCGHGTHVAGTISALNNDTGVVGVVPGGPPLHIVKVFGDSCGWAYSSDLVAALNKCTLAGAKIVNMSLGGGAPTALEEAAFDAAYTSGVLPIAAAGNGANSEILYPAGYSSVMSVGAVDSSKALAWFSQTNADVELVAPGESVLSTVPWTYENSVTVDGSKYSGNWIENAGRSEGATGALASGGSCGPAVDSSSWAGKVVLCARDGITTFWEMVTHVQSSLGVAALIYNNAPGNFDGTLGPGNSSAIPAVSLSQEDGLALVGAKLGHGGTVVSWRDPDAGSYEEWDGTSMATPHVSGVAALVWSHNPNWTNSDIRRSLQATALDLGQPGIDTSYGFGLVQALAASNSADPPTAPFPITLSGRSSRVKGKRQTSLSWTGGSARVSVFRNGVRIAMAIANDNGGTFTDSPPKTGNSFVYRVCDAHGATYGPTCSDVTITF
jgi:serine protease